MRRFDTVEHGAHDRQQGVRGEWLLDEGRSRLHRGVLQNRVVGIPGREQDFHARPHRDEPRRQLAAAHDRHDDVGDDEIDRASELGRDPNAFFTVGRFEHAVAAPGERLDASARTDSLSSTSSTVSVPTAGCGARRLGGTAGGNGAGETGEDDPETRVPVRAPSRARSLRRSAGRCRRPSRAQAPCPCPNALVVKNGSKMCDWISFVMPQPVSETVITTYGPAIADGCAEPRLGGIDVRAWSQS